MNPADRPYRAPAAAPFALLRTAPRRTGRGVAWGRLLRSMAYGLSCAAAGFTFFGVAMYGFDGARTAPDGPPPGHPEGPGQPQPVSEVELRLWQQLGASFERPWGP